jgi:hypothetical protein
MFWNDITKEHWLFKASCVENVIINSCEPVTEVERQYLSAITTLNLVSNHIVLCRMAVEISDVQLNRAQNTTDVKFPTSTSFPFSYFTSVFRSCEVLVALHENFKTTWQQGQKHLKCGKRRGRWVTGEGRMKGHISWTRSIQKTTSPTSNMTHSFF